MPYIKQERRVFLDSDVYPKNAGELNFTITCLLLDYFKEKGKNYQAINDIVGALEGAKMEFYARVARPFEDLKIKENGDVYE